MDERNHKLHRSSLGAAAVLCLLLVAGGGAVFAAADPVSGAIAFASCGVFALLVFRVLWVIQRPASELDDAGGSGGGGSWSPQGPRPRGTDDALFEFDWERFEREFRLYAERHKFGSRSARI